jgi:hypothetical protein
MGPYKTSDQATSHLELIANIRAATEWLQSNNEEWSPSLTGRKELLISARELVSALEPPDTSLWRVVLAVSSSMNED